MGFSGFVFANSSNASISKGIKVESKYCLIASWSIGALGAADSSAFLVAFASIATFILTERPT